MQSAATNAFQFATASGVAGPKAAEFSNEIVALASRAVALNPALGNVEEVAGTLTTKFAAGRGALGAYGIDLQKADINALALAETGKTLASELTKGEKAIATADLATQKYGNNIKDSVENASKNATIQVRQLKAAFEDAAGQIGAPLVSPMVETLKALIPIGVEAGRIVGQLAQVSLPLLTSAATAIAPTLGAVSSILGAIPEPIQQVAIAAGAGAFAWSRFGEAITNVPGTLRVLSTVVPPLVNSLGGLSGVAAIAAPVIAAIAVSAGAAALGYVTWKNSTADIDNAITELDSAVTAKHIPAITTAVSAVQKATQSHHDNSVALKDELDATNQAVTGTTQLGGSVEVYNNTAKNAEVFQKAFNTALKEGPATALVALGAFQQAGVATAFMGAQLDVAAHQAKNLQQAQAQVQAATAPLSTTFQQAATAAGGQTTAMFQAVGAVSAMADADVKVEAAQQQFNKAIETGDPIQVRAAASAQAGAVAQAAYADAIAHGVPPIQAGKDATAAFGAELQRLADAQPAGKLKDQLQDLSNTVQALPKTATVDVSAVTHGGEQVDSLKAKITALEPKTVQAIADAIGEPDVESLKTTIAGLTPKQVDAVARALGRGDVDALTAAVNGLTPKQVQAVADAIGKGDVDALKASVAGMTPKQVDAVARALGISDVNALKAAIAGVTGKTVTIQVLTAGVEAAKNILHSVGAASGGHIGAYASGGNVGTVGQPIVVGELGPELFVPDTPGTVLASSGGATPNVLSVNIDARGATREAVDRLKDIDWSKLKKLIDTPGPGMSNAFLGGRR